MLSTRDVALSVRGLSKSYNIATTSRQSSSLRESLGQRVWNRKLGSRTEPFWALKDIDFDVKQGEVVGIIGRNGAGKSTLLKILSQITEPTSGEARIYGRVGSLLEVGTGFHPELTGRENVYLNGAILGMKRREIDQQFDAIVDFAEIETFLDTPVKRYSSGMYVRLAFAVAAHLEPEVLVVDEVLAVGDARFQEKCLGKIDGVSRQGRTVLLVSHNIPAYLNICRRGILLERGRVTADGPPRGVLDRYLGSQELGSGEVCFGEKEGGHVGIRAVRVRNSGGEISRQVELSGGCFVEIDYDVLRTMRGVRIACKLWNSSGQAVLAASDIDESPIESLSKDRTPGRYRAAFRLDRQFLRPGRYTLDAAAVLPGVEILDLRPHAIAFEVLDTGSVQALTGEGSDAVLAPVIPWNTVQLSPPVRIPGSPLAAAEGDGADTLREPR